MQPIFFSGGALQEVYPLLVSVAIAPRLVPGGPLRDVRELSSIHHSARPSLDTAFRSCNTLHALHVPLHGYTHPMS